MLKSWDHSDACVTRAVTTADPHPRCKEILTRGKECFLGANPIPAFEQFFPGFYICFKSQISCGLDQQPQGAKT